MSAQEIPISGGSAPFGRSVRGALAKFPGWFVKAARIAKIEITNRPDVVQQIAMFEHGSRVLFVSPGVGGLLQKALGHELFHAVDDNFNSPHFFTSTNEWRTIHQKAPYFDIQKYALEPLEYFADQGTKLFMMGAAKMMTTNPDETRFIAGWVLPTLQREFS